MMRSIWLAVAACAAAGCVETEERIDVRADGSMRIRIEAKGDPGDLADGHPVPLGEPWRARDDATARWVGAMAGVPRDAIAARLASIGLRPDGDEIRLAVEATFADAAAVPDRFAPAGTPYRESFLRRSTSLEVARRGARTVYTFTRDYHRRDAWIDRHFTRVFKDLPEALQKRLEDDEAVLTDREWRTVATVFAGAYREAAEHLARGALLGVYVDGDGALPLAEHRRIVGRIGDAVSGVVTVDALIDAGRDLQRRRGGDAVPGTARIERLEDDATDAVRRALAAALASSGLDARVQNAIRYRLEVRLAAADHTDDLGDERFRVRVRMPGTVVGGNYHRARDGEVEWRFKGDALTRGAQRLRVVSVVE